MYKLDWQDYNLMKKFVCFFFFSSGKGLMVGAGNMKKAE